MVGLKEKMVTSRNRGLFLIDGSSLYLANDGNAFSRTGLLAICQSHLTSKSEKVSDQPKDPFPKVKDESWIGKLGGHYLKRFIDYPNELQRDRRQEQAATRDYAGRWIYEILQNIDDAIGPPDFEKFIGTKGLGFLSILEVAHSPEIFSGPFACKFSKVMLTNALIKNGFDETYLAELPSLQVPFPAEPDAKTQELLKHGFTTVIKFSILPEKQKDVISDLFTLDADFLLFSQHLDTLILQQDNAYYKAFSKEVESLDRAKNSFKDRIKIISHDGLKKTDVSTEWIRWGRQWKTRFVRGKRSSCIICLPFKNGSTKACSTKTRVFNFYPTDEHTEISAKLHVTFQLSQDRKRLQMWGDDTNWNNASCDRENIRLINESLLLVTDLEKDQLVPLETFLQVFRGLNQKIDNLKKNDTPLQRLEKSIILAVRGGLHLPVFGGGASSLSDARLWSFDLLDCLEETEEIAGENLVTKQVNKLGHILKDYGVQSFEPEDITRIFANYEINRSTTEHISKLCKVIKSYTVEIGDYIPYQTKQRILDIPIFRDVEGNFIRLSEGNFRTQKKAMKLPSWSSITLLSDESITNLEEYFLYEDGPYKDDIGRKLINSLVDYLSLQLKGALEAKNRDNFKDQDPFELLGFLYSVFLEDQKIFQDFIADLEADVFLLPAEGSDGRVPSSKIYFSETWDVSRGLLDWFQEESDSDQFQIQSLQTVRKKIRPFFEDFIKQKETKFASKTLQRFLEEIGVRSYPSPISLDMDDGWRNFRENFAGYNDSLNKPHRRTLNRCLREFHYKGLEQFFLTMPFEQRLRIVPKMLKETQERQFRASYRGDYERSFRSHPDFNNVAHYQLLNSAWLDVPQSLLHPDGLASPSETHLGKDVFKLFPCIDDKKLKLSTDNISFLKDLGLEDYKPPADSDILRSYAKSIGANFDGFYKGNKELASQNLTNFYKFFFRSSNWTIGPSFLAPARRLGSPDADIEMMPVSEIVWNDIIPPARLNEISSIVSHGLFIFDYTTRNNGKPWHYHEYEDFGELIPSLSSIINLGVLEEAKNKGDANRIWEDGEYDWKRIEKFYYVIKGEKKYEGIGFNDFKEKVVLCDRIELLVSAKDTESKSENDVYINIETSYKDPVSQQKYIIENNMEHNLIPEILSVFDLKKDTSLIEECLGAPDLRALNNILIKNDLDPNLLGEYDFFQEQQELEADEYTVSVNEMDEPEGSGDSIKEINEEDKSSPELPVNKSSRSNSASSKSKSLEKSEYDKQQGQSPAHSKDNGSGQNTPKKPQAGPRSRSSGFGRRHSGLVRARGKNHSVTVRNYFDDETDENRKIGDVAERYIDELLKREGKSDVTLIGGNNKGFDLTYTSGGNTHFVEIKGLSGNWDDSDILLSKAQFEKALEEKDLYSIYIVEYTEDPENRNHSIIHNPARYFTKVQLDHGWRNFEVNDDDANPEPGDFIEIDGSHIEIKEVRGAGKLRRLFFVDETPAQLYQPDSMALIKKSEGI